MRELRTTLRDLIPAPLRARYHRHAVLRDFGIDLEDGSRRQTVVDRRIPRGLNVIGYFESPSGLGQSARSLASAVEGAGIQTRRIEASAPANRRQIVRAYDVNLFHVNADGAAAVVEEMGPALYGGRANIGYWYWESDRFPEFWRDRFVYFDEIWVASEFCRRSIQSASPIPVQLLPPAIAAGEEDREAARSRLGLKATDFLYLTILDALSVVERKNPIATVQAFARAFPEPSDPMLHIQISHADQVPGLLTDLEKAGQRARVRIHNGVLRRDEIETLLAACDAYVSLHRAEGFGFPIAEAMALGKPVIATDYSGSTDYLDDTTGFPVRWKSMTLATRIRDYEPGTQWAEPDIGHAAEILRRVQREPGEARRRGEAARRRIEDRFRPEIASLRVEALLTRLRERLKKTA
jgi:glycosyltransferase involved in cell wall biosynthesis